MMMTLLYGVLGLIIITVEGGQIFHNYLRNPSDAPFRLVDLRESLKKLGGILLGVLFLPFALLLFMAFLAIGMTIVQVLMVLLLVVGLPVLVATAFYGSWRFFAFASERDWTILVLTFLAGLGAGLFLYKYLWACFAVTL